MISSEHRSQQLSSLLDDFPLTMIAFYVNLHKGKEYNTLRILLLLLHNYFDGSTAVKYQLVYLLSGPLPP